MIVRLVFWIALSLIMTLFYPFIYWMRTGSLRLLTSVRSTIFSLMLAGLFTSWVILWQMSIIPGNVNLAIIEPETNQVRYRESIYVTAMPDPERVYLLIHPHSTQFWYVQGTPTLKTTQLAGTETNQIYWKFDVQFGTDDQTDCEQKFDIIALASRDIFWLDLFRGRVLEEGEMVDMLQGRTVEIVGSDNRSNQQQILKPEYRIVGSIPVLNSSNQVVVTKICKESQ
jgi:hypothetical protein